MKRQTTLTPVLISGLILLGTLLITLSAVSAATRTSGIGQTVYIPFIPKSYGIGPGIVSGRVIDARTGNPIDGASVTYANQPSEITDEQGNYTFNNIPAGYQMFTAEANGYLELTQPVRVFPFQSNVLNFALSPDDLESEGQYRIIVTWKDMPPDLDAHLWTPDLIDGRPHVFQGNRGDCTQGTGTTACLDRDEIDGFGPETITILEAQPGTYYYGVLRFEPACLNPTPPPLFIECPQEIEESGARVQIYDYTGLRATYTIPTSGNVDHKKFWYVFQLEFGLGSEISLTPINGGDGCFTDLPSPEDTPPTCPSPTPPAP